ncbi:methionyl-tRNA formyltransferase [Sphingomonas rhizophila]|uniref:Methionyl-tRNA formyltransferase n=1 Tax=Sphingomonas rhizophila TaxID=2071607 RepID=A0A7G9SDR4_9SPHN|nr:methionyl-tRNA formyltransferase [Sphingomonas rhizophila]QNN65989.1 methionyl-tRNA formyltransferase [Sphingomonas rhizophila]
MRVIFMGSPDFAVPTLDALARRHDVICVYTQPPRPAGRGKADRPTAVEIRARDLGIEVRSPRSLKGTEEQDAFAALDADVAVVAAYGLILPQAVLDAPRLGCLNVHASLLPRWRGAAPVQRAIMAGDEETGVTIMQMEAGLDTGPMLLKRGLPIDGSNASELTQKLAELGAALMVEVLDDLPRHTPIAQPAEGVTYASKISKDEARIHWSRPAVELVRHVQGLAPFPGAWFEVGGERIKLLRAEVSAGCGTPGEVIDDRLTVATGNGALRPLTLQRSGKSAMPLNELLRGFAVPKGTRLA